MKKIVNTKATSDTVRRLMHLLTTVKRKMCIVCSEPLQFTDFLMGMDGSQSRKK